MAPFTSPRPLTRLRTLMFSALLFPCVLLAQPVEARPAQAAWSLPDAGLPARLESDVRKLVEGFPTRDRAHPEVLDRVAEHLAQRLRAAGGRVTEQVFEVKGARYRNVLARFGPEAGARLVVGAHYDAVQSAPGADDNASGVAGLLELARRFGERPPAVPIELAAYTLEESGLLGSREHARALATSGAPVRAMLSLEMIGCFLEAPDSQRYPLSVLKLFYPNQGNFIVVASRTGNWGLVRKVRRAMAQATPLNVRGFVGPRSQVPDIGRSDHASFWDVGFPSVMITDTANLRNTAYHTGRDLPDSLDYRRMAMVVLGVERALRAFHE